MSHFAKVIDGVVVDVLVVEQDFINTGALGDPSLWIQTSYNTQGGVHYDPVTREPSADQTKALRKNYAGIGYTYDAQRDAFIPPKEFDSWVLDENTCFWEPPVAVPEDYGTVDENNNRVSYRWDEEQQTNTGNGWVRELFPVADEE